MRPRILTLVPPIALWYDAHMPIGIMELVVIGLLAFVIYISIKRSSKKKD